MPDTESGDERAIGEEAGTPGLLTGEEIDQRVLGRYSRLVLTMSLSRSDNFYLR
jgi:hypothetical protein